LAGARSYCREVLARMSSRLPTFLPSQQEFSRGKQKEREPTRSPTGFITGFCCFVSLLFFFFLLGGGQTDGYFPSIKYPSPVPVLYNVNTYVRESKHCGRVVITPPFLGDGGWWMISHAFYWNRRWLFIAHACVCN